MEALKQSYLSHFTDVIALTAAISELTVLARKARTANWCALQMAHKDNPNLEDIGIKLNNQDGLLTYRVILDHVAATQEKSQDPET